MSPDARPTLLVVGASGYLGRRVALRARPYYRVRATYHSHPQPEGRALDLRDRSAIEACVADTAPSVVVNCAYVQQGPDVDAITEVAPGLLAAAAERIGAQFVHVSSDVVFPGRSDRPYREEDDPAPVHEYGRAKLRAEQLVVAAHQAPLIIRTSLIYGGRAIEYAGRADDSRGAEEGPQERMVREALAGGDMWFFTDEVRNPIEVDVLASAIVELAAGGHHGLLHVAGADAIDRFTFAQLLAGAMHADASVLRGRPRDATAAPRPGNLALDCTKAHAILRDTVLTGARQALSRQALSRRGQRSDRGS